MDFDSPSRARLARFWGVERVAARPGLKAVELFEAVADGRIKALWVMATNPAVSLPNAARVREALGRCPFVVVSDCMADVDTLAYANVALPARAWGEKDGTVTNSERRITRQRAFARPVGEARADWRIVADVATAMGFRDGFGWSAPHDVFREWARLTAYENPGLAQGGRLLDLSGLCALSREAYDGLEPVQWPMRTGEPPTPRLFADGRFQTPDGRARLVPVRPAGPALATDPAFPFSLNTGRIRDQWHTMTRTGRAPALCRHAPEPFAEVHPADAEPLGVRDGALLRIATRFGEAVAVARVTDAQRRGSVFMPMHWSEAFAPSGRANPLVSSAADPVSGQPEFKHTPARIAPYRETWSGFLITRAALAAPPGVDVIWRRLPQDGAQLHEFAGRGDERERTALRAALAPARGEPLTYDDAATGARREAWIVDGRLERVLFTTLCGPLPKRDWLVDLFAVPTLDARARAAVLLGRPLGPVEEKGALVCACRNVGAVAIGAAIATGCGSLDAVGARTGAGVTCGSCRPQIARLLAAALLLFSHEAQDAA